MPFRRRQLTNSSGPRSWGPWSRSWSRYKPYGGFRSRRFAMYRQPSSFFGSRAVGLRQVGRDEAVMNVGNTRLFRMVKTNFDFDSIAGTGSAVNQNFAVDPSTDIPDMANAATLYQSYKVEKVVISINYRTTEQTDNAAEPLVYIGYNYDATPGSAATDLPELANVRRMQFGSSTRTASYTVYPKIQVPAYVSGTPGDGSALVYGSKMERGWISTDNLDVVHYGWALNWRSSVVGQSLNLTITAVVLFKDPK